MKIEKAIYILKDLMIFDSDCTLDCLALEEAIKALNKEIPKEVGIHTREFIEPELANIPFYHCPCCKKTIYSVEHIQNHSDLKYARCRYCGQALKWESEVEK